MLPTWFMALAAAAPLGAPAVLTDPGAARTYAASIASSSPRTAAETLLFAGDPTDALDVLLARGVGVQADPRDLRLRADAYVALGDAHLARIGLSRLGEHAGWEVHAREQAVFLERAVIRRHLGRAGLLAFAVSLAVLVWGGARELLRPGIETVGFAVAWIGAYGAAHSAEPMVASMVGLVGAGALTLTHAASAAVRRFSPGARGRLMAVAMVLLGAAGLAVAALSRLDLTRIMGLMGP